MGTGCECESSGQPQAGRLLRRAGRHVVEHRSMDRGDLAWILLGVSLALAARDHRAPHRRMTKLHLCALGDSARAVLDWLAEECHISPQALASTISYPETQNSGQETVPGVPTVTMRDAAMCVGAEDIVIVAGPDFQRAVGDLLGMGLGNIYNGNEMILRNSVGRRFVKAASALYIGLTAATFEPKEAANFAVEP